ncbi:hypothetical protein HPB49_014449 [Dermacentor silvarum]|uniref:Uncharacterized protein n=1 Tax=Dermacentor silvarum TaxID=543639 RepID=A0ACB8C456_DERSI|nr:hypothetical protein HPB49_014449 [Dermacentor silvarum]
MGLFCSPEKSELLTIKPYTCDPGIDLFVHGQPVPKVDKIRILGLHIQSNLDARFTLNLLDKPLKQISGLVRRITSRNHGLSEKDTMQIIEALVVSRLAYHLPYHHLTEEQLDQANRVIRRAVKTALRLPVRTSTTRLLQTGLYNTVQEVIQAQRSNQLLRLSRTPTGRNLLRTLGFEPSGTIPNEETWCPIPVRLAAHMHLKPLPRNMNVQRYPGRRKARAGYYARSYQNREDVLYVDAAVGPLEGTAMAAAMTEDAHINISASVKTARTDVAEGVALALAVAHAAADSTITAICTDSQKLILKKRVIRITGMYWNEQCLCTTWFNQTVKVTKQAAQILRRIDKRTRGVKEKEMRHFVQASLHSPILYGAPFQPIT